MNNCNFFVHFSLYDRLYERIPLGMLLFSKGEHTRNIIFHLRNECGGRCARKQKVKFVSLNVKGLRNLRKEHLRG